MASSVRDDGQSICSLFAIVGDGTALLQEEIWAVESRCPGTEGPQAPERAKPRNSTIGTSRRQSGAPLPSFFWERSSEVRI